MEAEVEIPGNSRNGMFGSEDNDYREAIGDRTETEDGGGKEITVRGEENIETGYNKDKPPEDDCCPICFGEFKVPCKANCGHWFCGNCILQLWKYRSRPRRCKCPFCNSAISKLTPEGASSAVNSTEQEVSEVLEEIEQYNRFYVKGIQGFYLILGFYVRKHGPHLHLYMWRVLRAFLMVVITTPSFVKRVFVDLIRHPERIGLNYQRVRLISCTLSLLLLLYHGLLPPGHLRLQITKIRLGIDCGSILLVVLPYPLIMCKTWIHIWWLKFRNWQLRRELASLRAQNAALRERYASLRDLEAALRVQREAEVLLMEQDKAELQAEVDLAKRELELREAEAPLQGGNAAKIEDGTNLKAQGTTASPEAENGQEAEHAAKIEDGTNLQPQGTNACPETENGQEAENAAQIEDGTNLQAQGTTACPKTEIGQEAENDAPLQGKDISASPKAESSRQVSINALQETNGAAKIEDSANLEAQGTTACPETENAHQTENDAPLQAKDIDASPKAESSRPVNVNASQETDGAAKIEDGASLEAQGTTACPETENARQADNDASLKAKDINAPRETEIDSPSLETEDVNAADFRAQEQII